MLPEHKKLMHTFLTDAGVADVDRCLNTFNAYMSELARWNNVVNLTAIREEGAVVIKHFIDSLTPLRFINDNDFILDMGSGAGFPGMPIKIVKPSVKLVMLDARLKKVNFLNSLIHFLGVKNTTAIQQRAEAKDFQKLMRKSFDVVISRASFSLTELAKLSIPYMKNGGRLIAMKSKKVEDMNKIKYFKQIDEFITTLPDGSYRRIIVFGRK